MTLDEIKQIVEDNKQLIVKEVPLYKQPDISIMLDKLILAATYHGTIKEHEEREVILSLQN